MANSRRALHFHSRESLALSCLLACLCGQLPLAVKSTQTWPRYAGPFVTCSRKLSYSTTKGERLCVISSWLHQSGGKPHWAGHPELVISNHRACQDSISLTANWTNANEAGKTSFLLWREKPSQTGKKEREKPRVCLRDNEREQSRVVCACICVCEVEWGGRFFMQVSRLQWADSPPKSLIKAHHLSSFSLLSLSPCSVLQSIHHHPLCATEQLTTL